MDNEITNKIMANATIAIALSSFIEVFIAFNNLQSAKTPKDLLFLIIIGATIMIIGVLIYRSVSLSKN